MQLVPLVERPSALTQVLAKQRPLVTQMRRVQFMSFSHRKQRDSTAGAPIEDLASLANAEYATIEQDVVIRAEAEHVTHRIRSVVGSPHWSHVRAFGVRPSRSLQARVADLAGEVVELLDPLGHGGVANDPLDGRVALFGRARRGCALRWCALRPRIRNRVWRRRRHESVPPDVIARAALLLPVALDEVEPVVPVTAGRRVLRIAR
jgi:hypothetical protein